MNDLLINEAEVMHALKEVMDPEIPTLSVIDMGMIVSVSIQENKAMVSMIPTFTACPALHIIKQQIHDRVLSMGFENVLVTIDDQVIWNSDRITNEGNEKLKAFGLGSPKRHEGNFSISEIENSTCPHCGSDDTTLKSLFGSTLCRSIHFCFSCKQGFERFKPL